MKKKCMTTLHQSSLLRLQNVSYVFFYPLGVSVLFSDTVTECSIHFERKQITA